MEQNEQEEYQEEYQEESKTGFYDVDYQTDDLDCGFGKMDLRTCNWY